MTTRLAVNKLAGAIKAKREKRGLREAAEEIGDVSASTLSRIEQGKAPDLETFLRLCDWLQMPPEAFIESDDPGADDNFGMDGPSPSPSMSTLQVIEVHLRADRELDPESADALANMVRAAYHAIKLGKIGRNSEGVSE